MGRFGPVQYLVLFTCVLCCLVQPHVSGLQHYLAGVRSYRNYVVDRNTGFLRRIAPVLMTVEVTEPPPTVAENQTSDRTLLEAIPYSLDQLMRAYAHALLDRSWNIHEIAPVVHLDMLWIGETSRPISLPCWAPAQPIPIRLDQTTFRSHRRTWYIGQGNTLSLR
ncbi:unnamed protein product [Echinostoma caproni]|uniref:Secreted protein n=1 Tax=Echinostoma caproni TaxID=27848 RepID=A0A183AJU2_9TREM|nr:unnamed protein product [Echinostoma caproni]